MWWQCGYVLGACLKLPSIHHLLSQAVLFDLYKKFRQGRSQLQLINLLLFYFIDKGAKNISLFFFFDVSSLVHCIASAHLHFVTSYRNSCIFFCQVSQYFLPFASLEIMHGPYLQRWRVLMRTLLKSKFWVTFGASVDTNLQKT